MKLKLESRLPGEMSEPQICRGHHPYGRRDKKLKSLLIKVEEESEKSGSKLSIQTVKVMASGSVTS